MNLFIDTSGLETKVSLADNKANVSAEKKWPAGQNQSEELLIEIDKLFSQSGYHKDNLESISVVVGPGSYTGIRVGVATANALAYALNIPVLPYENDSQNETRQTENNRNSVSYALPVYKNPPHITKPKA